MIIIIFVMRFFYRILERNGFTITSNQINVDENLPNFFQAVKLSDADWMVYENSNLRNNYGF